MLERDAIVREAALLDMLPWMAETLGRRAHKSQPSVSTSPPPKPERIRSIRQAAGLTQARSAAMVHASLRTWQQWEAGDRRMHPGLWELFCLKTAVAGQMLDEPTPPPR